MKPPCVLKFGGTSLRDAAACEAAVARVGRAVVTNPVAVVVSAMGRRGDPYATDTLIGLLRNLGEPVAPRELDLAMSVGEVLSAASFAHRLSRAGIPARAFTGPQAGILTNDRAGSAEIMTISPHRVRDALMAGEVAVVAGFQGADAEGEIHTLGRGGSDTSAVALGAALDTMEVVIFTDVDGIAVADPRQIPTAPYLDEVASTTVLAMAQEGSRVLHPRAVRAAMATATPLRTRNTFTDASGTLIHHHPPAGPMRPAVLAHRGELVLLRLAGEPPATLPELFAIGEGRWLLPDDAYLSGRLGELANHCGGPVAEEHGWATATVVLEGATTVDRPAGPVNLPPSAESVMAPAGCWRWMVREAELKALLELLYTTYLG